MEQNIKQPENIPMPDNKMPETLRSKMVTSRMARKETKKNLIKLNRLTGSAFKL